MTQKQQQISANIKFLRMKKIHISKVNAGQTVLHNGEVRTVCNSDIRHCKFMGITLFGDSYNLGYKPVILVDITQL